MCFVPQPRITTHNRKLPPLPPLDSLAKDDLRRWAIVFTRARLRKGLTYLALATRAEVSVTTAITACTTGACNSLTALRLAAVLDLSLPSLPHVLTAQEAHHGRPAIS